MSTQIPYVDAQVNLNQLCDRVVETGEAVIITRPDGKNVALVSEVELSSLLETLYLLRSPANAARLTSALERSKAGTVQPQAINDLYQRFGLEDNDTGNEITSSS
ncbi:type II toxin-antitoxin system Phd/YefM family antitoxin [Planktothrix agardhii 1806]|jgi:antitoxin YefM|uniref:type II toxin-antitoxin system Phd/YefM family antitoxin n=1 Tax=Planktothrix agardhii TaxID=1160 RepID=UPI001F26B57E|nr:type II toxin-antitoxin system Phd/YefM family antitoxin [Planktothrix agardhii]MCF3570286.1 type II toxin-antitoxin system Phd/YefM family antitoxin [Planktothrix agardhii 1805]MCF3586666.1 type II toxin-antitoxin system Phd/YefM family antitoxin [Planktothrix agardhii 1803]MCF3603531.1 type II toxin-antitoxin system Phd/YefM family antitoxin [Planktothrix agardhii 1804]MCF3615562.1 type II toxin-antitoxin system Phd/YefM family antitoxin [Planktothrix agardhii 1806]MCP9294484.1 type II to